MIRYICKKCGRFVSKDARVCKCCGCEDPAIEKIIAGPKTNSQTDERKYIECPNCGFIFNSENKISSENVQCPSCSMSIKNPYYSKTSGYTTKKKIFGIIILLIIGFNIYRSCYHENDVSLVDVSRHYNSNAAESELSISNQADISQMMENKEAPNSIVFKVEGANEPCLKWIIKSENGKFQFQYIAEDRDDKSILKSGYCGVMTFGQLKSQAPNTVIRNCTISTDKKIMLIGPIDTHYNSDYSERPVFGILVASKNSKAQLFINDTDEENVFILLDNLEMEIN